MKIKILHLTFILSIFLFSCNNNHHDKKRNYEIFSVAPQSVQSEHAGYSHDFINEYASILCEKNSRCRLNSLPSDISSCQRVIISSFSRIDGDYQFIEENRNICINEINRMSCDDFKIVANQRKTKNVINTTCRNVLRGFSSVHDNCEIDEQCIPGLVCLDNKCRNTNFCLRGEDCNFPTVGQRCDETSSCGPGLDCINNACSSGQEKGESCVNHRCSDGLFCIDEVCSLAKYEQKVRSQCSKTLICDNGLYCDAKTLKCLPSQKLEENCTSAPCERGLYCINETCSISPIVEGVNPCPSRPICGQRILPGHLFGHLKTGPSQQGSIHEGFGTYMLSVNRKNGHNFSSVLLSPLGTVADPEDDCPLWCTPGEDCYENCLETYNMDEVAGSSGGPVFHYYQSVLHRIMAIQSGLYYGIGISGPWDQNNRNIQSSGASDSGNNFSDRQAYISNLAQSYKYGSHSTTPIIAHGTRFSLLQLYGGTGGYQHIAHCNRGNYSNNTNFLAVGVVGTTHPGGYVGNFGLVCLSGSDSEGARQLDQAKVVWGGSQGTATPALQSGEVIPVDFNEYWNEYLDNEPLTNQLKQQSVVMCKSEYFLKGIILRSGSYVDKIEAIICEHYTSSLSYTKYLTSANAIGSSNGGTLKIADCVNSTSYPLPGYSSGKSFINGAIIKSANLTDGLYIYCQNK